MRAFIALKVGAEFFEHLAEIAQHHDSPQAIVLRMKARTADQLADNVASRIARKYGSGEVPSDPLTVMNEMTQVRNRTQFEGAARNWFRRNPSPVARLPRNLETLDSVLVDVASDSESINRWVREQIHRDSTVTGGLEMFSDMREKFKNLHSHVDSTRSLMHRVGYPGFNRQREFHVIGGNAASSGSTGLDV